MATAPDEEVFYAIDDYTNYEFIDRYQPFPSDPTKGGLGLEVTVRILQFNNPMAEDIIFMVYQVTNASEKDLDKVYFGMYGDPHVGGSTDYNDDRAFFVPPILPPNFPSFDQRARSMVYDGMKIFREWVEKFQVILGGNSLNHLHLIMMELIMMMMELLMKVHLMIKDFILTA